MQPSGSASHKAAVTTAPSPGVRVQQRPPSLRVKRVLEAVVQDSDVHVVSGCSSIKWIESSKLSHVL